MALAAPVASNGANMRDLRKFNKYRCDPAAMAKIQAKCGSGPGPLDERFEGAFLFPMDQGDGRVVMLKVLASTGLGWDHVSVSCEYRIPTWLEMEFVKRLLFEDNEVAMQLHVPPKDHINNNPFVLHLWRPRSRFKTIPMPPKELV